MADTCRYCGCDQAHPCEGGCAWADETKTVCSQCSVAAGIASHVFQILSAIVSNPRHRIRLADASWDTLTLAHQQLLLMSCRATIEGMRDALLQGLDVDSLEAGFELNAIASFLMEKAPQVCGEDSIADTVIRLLEPHLTSRIVLPDGARL